MSSFGVFVFGMLLFRFLLFGMIFGMMLLRFFLLGMFFLGLLMFFFLGMFLGFSSEWFEYRIVDGRVYYYNFRIL